MQSVINENEILIRKIQEYYESSSRNERFNLFTAISDQYKKENLHSDILKILLDPRSPKEIQSKSFFKIFVENVFPDQNDFIENFDNVKVVREKGRIDILLYDDIAGIIIENKINDAVDQNNQLARYYELLKQDISEDGTDLNVKRRRLFGLNQKLQKVKVIYIAKNEYKKPNFDTYTDWYKKYIAEMDITYLPVKSTDNMSLVHLLELYLKQPNLSDIQKIFIGHYKDLLEKIGSRIMTNSAEKELIKSIFINKKQTITNQLVNTWKSRGSIISDILYEELENTKGIEKKTLNNLGGPWLVKGSDDLGVYLCGIGEQLQMGIYSTKKIYDQEDIEKYQNYIQNLNCDIPITDVKNWQNNWIYFNFYVDEFKIDELKKEVLKVFNQLSDLLKNDQKI